MFVKPSGDGAAYIVVWIFRQNFGISTVVLQESKTCEAMWGIKEQITELVGKGVFINYTYPDELFDKVYSDEE